MGKWGLRNNENARAGGELSERTGPTTAGGRKQVLILLKIVIQVDDHHLWSSYYIHS